MIHAQIYNNSEATFWEVITLAETIQSETCESKKLVSNLQEIDVSKIPSPVLARLIEEVRNEEELNAQAYNRMHNRHNRSR